MKISPKGLDPDIYNLISEDIFELVAYHLLFNSGDTREYQFNKKIFSIKNDRNAIKSKIASISKKIIDISELKDTYIPNSTSHKIHATSTIEINKDIKERRLKETISQSDLEWIIKHNHRQCLYLFLSLLIHEQETSILARIITPEIYNNKKSLTNTSTILNRSILEHFNPEIEHNFDLMHEHLLLFFISINKNIAIALMDTLKAEWSKALKNNNHDWIDKENTYQINWIIEYFKKSNIEPWFINNNQDLYFKYYLCVVLIDLWQQDDFIEKIGSKDYFLEKMKRSWSQQKYRLSVKDKKSINLRVDKEIEKKINKLCTDLKLTKSQLIELLLKNK
ncbi:CopG family transcriptional regulator [Vibrio cholerae]|uniref:CopG family transcriptional regulator n=1 Tax=Vibrio cholerae TaxID=666 RepID=UPI000E6C9F7A|nr:CopG family transcriptional regulator [Vibrio cholerae]EGQ8673200.1 CopG family transcriptional regulator [Vibrio cholerae]EGQ9463963.1 CopG family transcriptional regulator [Vibrio cholerae]EGR1330406.1 CopG family transcriptional regulator [Vibrio cholerae]EGR2401861.1 CopG family transcriptional regulator [Vibrio cholerae]EHS1101987.1 CopG family transcriptional regulator [Vibrio cholerae]